MTESKKECNCSESCCNNENEILHGFKFGFGFFLATLAGWGIVTVISMVFYYLLKAVGVSF